MSEPSPPGAPSAHLGAVAAVSHDHLLRIRIEAGPRGAIDGGAEPGPDGDRVVVVDDARPRVGLDTVLEVRGTLRAAEVSFLGSSIGRALAALHADGVAHGAVSSRTILLARDGHPVLAPGETHGGLGEAGPVSRPASSADDVAGLAALLTSALSAGERREHDPDGSAAAARARLRGVLQRTRYLAPGTRPTAGTFAAECDAACSPEPVRVPDPADLAGAVLGGAARARRSREAVEQPARAVRPARPARRGLPAGPARAGRTGSPGRGGARRPRPVLIPALVGVSVLAMAAAAFAVVGPWTAPLGSVSSEGARSTVAAAPVGPADDGSASDGSADEGADSAPRAAADVPGDQAVPAGESAPADAAAQHDDPAAAARALTARRVSMLALASEPRADTPGRPDLDDGAGYAVAGSPAAEEHEAQLRSMSEDGIVVRGVSVTVDRAVVVGEAEDERTVVDVAYRVGEHEQEVDGVIERVPASDEEARLVLTWTDAGWRVGEVL
ncbi:hypothetical protein GCM10025865_25920 [Paraoerskovia sediminicola]|uniref:Protein kinase domain-containing protein n=1 Tax=Paraoerskovia sediminicola TaxID=1138587 RepID=A0ABM8G5B8_9CELL|nr:hypothetical protein [Paraoerskovia sediminicola]BDZ43293.1 hypothetical protein GCM10025865_25920 [Paraoerskovia sediminicola]